MQRVGRGVAGTASAFVTVQRARLVGERSPTAPHGEVRAGRAMIGRASCIVITDGSGGPDARGSCRHKAGCPSALT